VMQN